MLGAGDHVSWRIVGMLVAVYAPAYFWAARYPERHAHLITVALLGKAWWPAFALLLRDAARLRGGWRPLLWGR